MVVNMIAMDKTLFFVCCIWLGTCPSFVYCDVYNFVMGNQYNNPDREQTDNSLSKIPKDVDLLPFGQKKVQSPNSDCLLSQFITIESLSPCDIIKSQMGAKFPESFQNPVSTPISFPSVYDVINIPDPRKNYNEQNSNWIYETLNNLNGWVPQSNNPWSPSTTEPSFFDLLDKILGDNQKLPKQQYEDPSLKNLLTLILNESSLKSQNPEIENGNEPSLIELLNIIFGESPIGLKKPSPNQDNQIQISNILNKVEENSESPKSQINEIPSFSDLIGYIVTDDPETYKKLTQYANIPIWGQIIMNVFNESEPSADKSKGPKDTVQGLDDWLIKIQHFLNWIDDNQENPNWPRINSVYPAAEYEIPQIACWLINPECKNGKDLNEKSNFDFEWNFRIPIPQTTDNTTTTTTTPTPTTTRTTTEATTNWYPTDEASTLAPDLEGCIRDCP